MGLRQIRMADQIRDILGKCFSANQMMDPRLGGVTVTAVKLSKDLQIATVYFRVYGDSSKDDAKKGLESASGFLRKKLAASIDLRRVPELRFFYDESVEKASRIEDLLRQL